MIRSVTIAALFVSTAALAQTPVPTVPKPAALVADGLPALPAALAARTRSYMEFRTAGFAGWNARDRSMLISTRFGNTAQLHRVSAPMMDRQQISFEAEPVGGRWSPTGDILLVSKDNGGDEFFQLSTLIDGKLTLLTDGKSRNQYNAWSDDGRLVAYTSTRRNGTDNDIYVVDPRAPASNRLVAEVKGGGWSVADFAPDGRRAIIAEYRSINKTNLWMLDIASGKLTAVGDHAKPISYGDAQFAPDGSLWVTSDEGSDFQRLGTLDPASGRFTPKSPEARWDVDSFDIARNGKFIAYTVNEAGQSRVRVMDLPSGRVRTVTALSTGVAGGVRVAPWSGAIGLSYVSAKGPTDAYSIDPATLAVTRWTQSETGGLDATGNVEPELVEVKSFDGEAVSGFLYRPDATRFPGKRPLLVNIHGGPEGQSQPSFQGRSNYYLNELGVAIFYPNVRGSTGFGKRFVALDNGAFKREDSVKDIGAFLDRLSGDAALDASRFAVTGGSYGGYMCYATAIRYATRFKSALCTVAISNFVTFLENTQSYRRDLRRVEYGDERNAAERAKLLEISPMTRSNELKIPLFVVTGGNDPRVPASEADQMVKAVRANGQTAWHLLGQNEGHGFAKKENQDYLFLASLTFWQQTLLGQK